MKKTTATVPAKPTVEKKPRGIRIPRNSIATGKNNSVTVHFPDRHITATFKFGK